MGSIIGIYERRDSGDSGSRLSASLSEALSPEVESTAHWLSSFFGIAYLPFRQVPKTQLQNSPLYDSVSNTVIAADLRLDNRLDLGNVLGYSPSEIADISDVNLILSAWAKWGKECAAHIVGDFAFAIWDINRRTLFCARDHIGARPFYYSHSPQHFVFASQIKDVVKFPEVSEQLDEDYAISAIIDHRFFHKTETFLKSVKKLAPGHSLVVTPDDFKLDRYWFPEDVSPQRFSSDDQYAEAALAIYENAICDRLQKNSAVGIHLTGGLDSSSIAVLAARELRRRNGQVPSAYCWQPPPDRNSENDDEYKLIEAVCEQEGLTIQYCPPNAKDVFEILSRDATCNPTDGTLLLETTVQKKAVEQGIQTILSGFGGDESLSHSGRGGFAASLLLHGRWRELYRYFEPYGSPLKLMAIEALLLPFRDRVKARKRIAARSLRDAPPKLSLISRGLTPKVDLGYTQRRLTSVRSSLLWTWQTGLLAERLESWAASGAERKITYAYPLLDRRLMEFVIGLPPEQFVNGKWKRWIMRKAMDQILPEKVRWYKSKLDPNRSGRTKKEFRKALEMAGMRLADKKGAQLRGRYLDLPKLLKQLQPENLAGCKKQGVILNAVQFLDI